MQVGDGCRQEAMQGGDGCRAVAVAEAVAVAGR